MGDLHPEELKRFSDEQLIAHSRDGLEDAVAVLLDRYKRLVRSIAFRILRDVGEAEDLRRPIDPLAGTAGTRTSRP